MARNPYIDQHCAGRHVIELMRDINAIEHFLEQTISHWSLLTTTTVTLQFSF